MLCIELKKIGRVNLKIGLNLGTNTLGFNIIYSDGTTVEPNIKSKGTIPKHNQRLNHYIRHRLHAAQLGQQHTVKAEARVDHISAVEVSKYNLGGIVVQTTTHQELV